MVKSIKCPVCKRIHVVQDYDTDYVCDNSLSQEHKTQNVISDDLMSKNNWNLNEWDTREDDYRDYYLDKLKKEPSDKNRRLGGTRSHNW